MVVNIPNNGLQLESSSAAMAGLPLQAFAITLNDSVIEDMIKCVQDGGGIQLSLGSNPAFLFDKQTVKIPKSPEPYEYDLFQSNSATPTHLNKLPNPTMSVFRVPKTKSLLAKTKAPKAPKVAKGRKASTAATKQSGELEVEALDDAIANLKNSMAKAEAEKRENSTVIVDNIPTKGGKGKGTKSRLLAPVPAPPRSIPASPALSGLGSPSFGPTGAAQEKVKQQRFPIIHELAVQELSFNDIQAKYGEGTDEEFNAALNKVADFDNGLQKWALKKMYWKELDVFQYDYAQEADRQKAIDNAIKQYDRMRLGSSDPLWQKLLPLGERGKGICLSKLQAAIAKGPAVPTPKIGFQRDGTSPSGGDSERDDSASSGTKKGKGGEPMSRSSSQTSIKKKLSASEAQAKRLLANSKKPAAAKPAAVSIKPSPKVSPTKPTAKAPPVKGGRVLSKEFISDSDSDNDEVPLSTSLPKTKVAPPKPAERAPEKPKPIEKPKVAEKVKVSEKPKAAEKPKTITVPKVKAAPAAKPSPRDREQEKEKDTIRAQVIAKPVKLPVKRPREVDDDDSSSSGTPLSKRIKQPAKTQVSAVSSVKKRAPSDASQNSRSTNSGVSLAKSKNTSPIKSSPLASSPPTNASDIEDASSSSSSSGSSVGLGRKRPADSSSDSKMAKRQRVSPEVMLKAHRFKQFYVRYHELHEEISRNDNPHPDKVADLVDMRDRLSEMKREIYSEVTVD